MVLLLGEAFFLLVSTVFVISLALDRGFLGNYIALRSNYEIRRCSSFAKTAPKLSK